MFLDKLLWDEKIECEKSSPLHIICIENIYLNDCIIHTIVPKLQAGVHVSVGDTIVKNMDVKEVHTRTVRLGRLYFYSTDHGALRECIQRRTSIDRQVIQP